MFKTGKYHSILELKMKLETIYSNSLIQIKVLMSEISKFTQDSIRQHKTKISEGPQVIL